jgi:hypothetical protein
MFNNKSPPKRGPPVFIDLVFYSAIGCNININLKPKGVCTMKTLYNINNLVKNLEPIICECCGKVSYSAKEVCELLGIDDVDRALRELDPDMKDEMFPEEDWDLAESDKTDVITLNGILALVFQSQTSFAKMTQRWIIDKFVEKVLLSEGESKELGLLPAGVEC